MAQGNAGVQSPVEGRLKEYVKRVQALSDEHHRQRGWRLTDKFEYELGRKYARVFCVGDQRIVHTFVDLANGNVLKADGWKRPSLRNPRSNVFDKDYGLSGVEWTGAKYITQLLKESK